MWADVLIWSRINRPCEFFFRSRLLLQNNADVNIKDLDGWTPLHAASHWGQKEAVELLVENMADMEAKNKLVGFLFCSAMRSTYE